MTSQAEYNAWFREMILTHCPELFAEVLELEHDGVRYLEAVIPHEDERRVIRLSTYGRELTPHIHNHHRHMDQFIDDNHEEEFQSAIGWIRDVMADKVFICSEFSGDRLVCSLSTYALADLSPRAGRRIEVLTYSGDGSS